MPIQPTAQQLNQLTNALLEAFSYDELTRLVRTHFEKSLEWFTPVAGKRDLTTITSDLVAYFASQEGGLKKLLIAAIRENPLNKELNGLGGEWGEIEFAPLPVPEDHPSKSEIVVTNSTTIDTGGGAYIGGDVDTGGGGFVGRDQTIYGDQVQGDKIGGDKVDGDKIVANIGDGNTGIAIGKNITQTINTGVDLAQLNILFAGILQAAAAVPGKQAEAVQMANELKAEAAKGDQAEDTKMAKLIDGFVELVPAGVTAVASTFASPILAGVAGPVTKYAIERLTGK